MFADADHEVIDSPEALYRHLYEEHGIAEARDLDPETAPLQFWLRRHAELERADRAARRQPEPPAEPSPRPPARPGSEPRLQPPRTPPSGSGRDGRRHPGFGDPLVEAVARALVGRGYDQATVRSAIRSFSRAGQGPTGEPAVRQAFVEPMLQSVAEHLLGATSTSGRTKGPPGTTEAPRPSTHHQPPAAPPPPEEPARPPREQPARPEAAWAVLWADLADTGRQAGDGTGTSGEDRDDLMAVANAVQARRRVRLLRR